MRRVARGASARRVAVTLAPIALIALAASGPVSSAQTPSARSKTVRVAQFRSPSHNLQCILGDEELAYCESLHPPHNVSLSHTGKLRTCRGARCVCSSNCSVVSLPTLRYGEQDVYAGYRCLSLRAGVRCTVVRSGKGFLISRSGVRRVP